jgi:hypothetical protein
MNVVVVVHRGTRRTEYDVDLPSVPRTGELISTPDFAAVRVSDVHWNLYEVGNPKIVVVCS